jgi:hypothetical protein
VNASKRTEQRLKIISEGKSTETVIHEFLENIAEATEKKMNVTGIFYDISKII